MHEVASLFWRWVLSSDVSQPADSQVLKLFLSDPESILIVPEKAQKELNCSTEISSIANHCMEQTAHGQRPSHARIFSSALAWQSVSFRRVCSGAGRRALRTAGTRCWWQRAGLGAAGCPRLRRLEMRGAHPRSVTDLSGHGCGLQSQSC